MVFVAGVGRAGQLERDHASRVGDDQVLRRQGGELRLRRRCVHLVLAELGQGAVDLGEQQEAAEGAVLAQTAVALGLLGRGHPGGPLGLLERPPAGRHLLRMVRTVICAGVRGLAGMASARLIWPNWPACETFRPRLPDCGMSNIFIRYFLSLLFVVVVKWRAWPAGPTNCARQSVCRGAGTARVAQPRLGSAPMSGTRWNASVP